MLWPEAPASAIEDVIPEKKLPILRLAERNSTLRTLPRSPRKDSSPPNRFACSARAAHHALARADPGSTARESDPTPEKGARTSVGVWGRSCD